MRNPDLLTIQEAAEWASSYLGRLVTVSNISYLIQYGRIRKYKQKSTLVSKEQLKEYYNSKVIPQERVWKKQLGDDINWELSFSDIRETTRTKHVHRLHPYKGKYIPQLVEYFLDGHTDPFKEKVYFSERDIILDPFVGSGTTLVQCLELGLHSIGVDISKYNCMIAKAKTNSYDLQSLESILTNAAESTVNYSRKRFSTQRNEFLDSLLAAVNRRFFPIPEYKQLIHQLRSIDSNTNTEDIQIQVKKFLNQVSTEFELTIDTTGEKKLLNEFTREYSKIALEFLSHELGTVKSSEDNSVELNPDESEFLQTWFIARQRAEMQHYISQIEKQTDERVRNLMRIILSRTARSCRATTHSDLATLVIPQYAPYYCRKHFKICRPVNTIISHLRRYTNDTVKRLKTFSTLKQDVFAEVINADSSEVDILSVINSRNPEFAELLKEHNIAGVFSSPPYIGQIDYHEQHAYAYELFHIERKDELEIGPKSNGVSRRAQEHYIRGISGVLRNATRFLKDDANIFIVANDKRNLYPEIADKSGLRIVEIFKRPVLNRTERDKQPYAESIFHMVRE